MNRRTDEEKMLFDNYVSLTTIQRYFSLSKTDAVDLFVKIQEADEERGYLKLFDNKVRAEGVFETLGLDIDKALKRYVLKKGELYDRNNIFKE